MVSSGLEPPAYTRRTLLVVSGVIVRFATIWSPVGEPPRFFDAAAAATGFTKSSGDQSP